MTMTTNIRTGPRVRRFPAARRCLAALLAAAAAAASRAQAPRTLWLAQVYQDGMVLQRDRPVPVRGWTEPGAAVTVFFAGQRQDTRADANGAWQVALEPMPAAAEGRPLTVRSRANAVTVRDVLVGEVWLVAGETGAARTIGEGDPRRPGERRPETDDPLVRFVSFGFGAAAAPNDDTDPFVGRAPNPWRPVTPESGPAVSGLGWFFARELRRELDVPVGLVQAAVPGTPITAWMSARSLVRHRLGDVSLADEVAETDALRDRLGQALDPFIEIEDAWRRRPDAAPENWPGHERRLLAWPTVLYNTRIHPLRPFALRGVLWHGGESGPFEDTAGRLAALARDWREQFDNRDLVFLYGNHPRTLAALPPMTPAGPDPRSVLNAELLRAARQLAADGPAFLVNLHDLGPRGVYGAREPDAGRRLAGAALDGAYGKPRVHTGPQLDDIAFAGATVRCRFRHAGGGLVHAPSIESIGGFVLEDESGAARWGAVRIAGPDALEVSHPDIPRPRALSYGSHANPHETLFNREGFPAAPFRFGRSAAPAADPGPALLRIVAPERDDVHLEVARVRRDGYVFRTLAPAGVSLVRIRAWVGSDWPAVDVRLQSGEPLAIALDERDAAGRRFIEFLLPYRGRAVVVARPDRAAEFRDADRF